MRKRCQDLFFTEHAASAADGHRNLLLTMSMTSRRGALVDLPADPAELMAED